MRRRAARWRSYVRATLVAFTAPRTTATPSSPPIDSNTSAGSPWGFRYAAADIDWSTTRYALETEVGPCGCACSIGRPCSGCGHAQCGTGDRTRIRTHYRKAA
jgi:hypothetical protein